MDSNQLQIVSDSADELKDLQHLLDTEWQNRRYCRRPARVRPGHRANARIWRKQKPEFHSYIPVFCADARDRHGTTGRNLSSQRVCRMRCAYPAYGRCVLCLGRPDKQRASGNHFKYGGEGNYSGYPCLRSAGHAGRVQITNIIHDIRPFGASFAVQIHSG